MVKKYLPLLIILVLLVLFGLGIALATYLPDTFNTSNNINKDNIVNNDNDFTFKSRNAILSLDTDSTKVTYQVGDEITLQLKLDTKQWNIVGFDAIVNYPEELVEVSNITTTDTFENYPLAKAEAGVIKISGLKDIGDSVRGEYLLAEMTLKFLATGQADLAFDYIPFQTTESNVVENNSGEDMLGIVNNISFTIN